MSGPPYDCAKGYPQDEIRGDKAICEDDAGPFMVAHSGHIVHLLNPKPGEICLDDIAWHLSNLVRFTGAASEPWTVLHHVVYCGDIARALNVTKPAWMVHVYLHDAHEAYTNDLSTPLKLCLNGGRLKDIQDQIQKRILESLGIPPPEDACSMLVHGIDRMAFVGEWKAFMPKQRATMYDSWPTPPIPPVLGDIGLEWFMAQIYPAEGE